MLVQLRKKRMFFWPPFSLSRTEVCIKNARCIGSLLYVRHFLVDFRKTLWTNGKCWHPLAGYNGNVGAATICLSLMRGGRRYVFISVFGTFIKEGWSVKEFLYLTPIINLISIISVALQDGRGFGSYCARYSYSAESSRIWQSCFYMCCLS